MTNPAPDRTLAEAVKPLPEADRNVLVWLLNQQFTIEAGKPISKDQLLHQLRAKLNS